MESPSVSQGYLGALDLQVVERVEHATTTPTAPWVAPAAALYYAPVVAYTQDWAEVQTTVGVDGAYVVMAAILLWIGFLEYCPQCARPPQRMVEFQQNCRMESRCMKSFGPQTFFELLFTAADAFFIVFQHSFASK